MEMKNSKEIVFPEQVCMVLPLSSRLGVISNFQRRFLAEKTVKALSDHIINNFTCFELVFFCKYILQRWNCPINYAKKFRYFTI